MNSPAQTPQIAQVNSRNGASAWDFPAVCPGCHVRRPVRRDRHLCAACIQASYPRHGRAVRPDAWTAAEKEALRVLWRNPPMARRFRRTGKPVLWRVCEYLAGVLEAGGHRRRTGRAIELRLRRLGLVGDTHA